MTLAQIADALGTTEATAQRYESGKGIKSIPYEVIEKYANIFGCKPQYIMGWSEEIEKNPVGMAEKHVEMILDEDISEIFDDFKNFVIDLTFEFCSDFHFKAPFNISLHLQGNIPLLLAAFL
jgi:transcriptional regulator with XRE-family HTH domain